MRYLLRPNRFPLPIAALIGAAALGLAGTAFAVVSATAPPDFVSALTAAHSAKCLSVPDTAVRTNAVGLLQERCTGAATQRFEFTRAGEGTYEIRSAASGYCVDVGGSRRDDGAAVVQRSRCTGRGNQRFTLRAAASAERSYLVVARHSGKCLDVLAGGQRDGDPVLQWTCGDPSTAGSQIWRIDHVDPSDDGSSGPLPGHATVGPNPSAMAAQAAPSAGAPGAAASTGGPAGSNPLWGQSLPVAQGRPGRAYELINGVKERGYQPREGECSPEIHARYWTYGPDGKVYPTWHPPTDPSGCAFGHEHGDDPRNSSLFATIGWPAFGYTNELLVPSSQSSQRDEDHVGHKVAARDSVQVRQGDNDEGQREPTGPVTMTCNSIIKFHQGTHSAEALTENLHELIYNVQCVYADNGGVIETRFSALVPVGRPDGFTGTDCGDGTTEHAVRPGRPGGSPEGRRSGRFIPDAACAAEVVNGRRQTFDLSESWTTDVSARAPQLRDFQIMPVFFVLNPSRYFDPALPGQIGRPIDLCYAGAPGFQCDQVRRMTAGNGGIKIAYDDPRSPFNGAQRQFDPGVFVVRNEGPSTLYTDVFGQRFSTTEFPGSIKQYIFGNHPGDRGQGSIRGTLTNYAANPSDRIHAPN